MKKTLGFIVISVLLSRIMLYIIFMLHTGDYNIISFFGELARNFDCGSYVQIAGYGYNYDQIPNINCEWAFFPLWPFLMRIFPFDNGILFNIGIVVLSNILFVIALIIAAKYLYDTRKKHMQVILFIILMTFGMYSIYYSVAYAEALYFLILILGFYFLNKRNYLAVGICGAFLSATRITGVFLVFPMIVRYIMDYFENKKINFLEIKNFILYTLKDYKFLFSIVVVPLGLFLYMGYLYEILGDAWAFSRAHLAWDREITSTSIFALIKGVFEFGRNMEEFYYLLWWLLGIYILIVAFKEKKYVELAMLLPTFVSPLLSGQLYSYPRFFIGSVFSIIILTDKIIKMEKYSAVYIVLMSCLLEVACVVAWYDELLVMC